MGSASAGYSAAAAWGWSTAPGSTACSGRWRRRAEEVIGRARAADRAFDVQGAATGYRQALRLWRGPFRADLPDHAALDPARHLYAEMRWEALTTGDLVRCGDTVLAVTTGGPPGSAVDGTTHA